jgi:hypothetical protein
MLIQPDKSELGDLKLDPKESVYREREELLKLASSRKIDGQEELEDAERSAGPRMAWQEVIRRLRKCNPNLLFLDAQGGGHIAIYRPKTGQERENIELLDDTRPAWWNDHMYVTGFPKHEMPEFPHVILDTSNLPVREYRGWRSVLMALIKSGAISYTSAIQQFGEPTDSRSGRWHEQLRPYKPK